GLSTYASCPGGPLRSPSACWTRRVGRPSRLWSCSGRPAFPAYPASGSHLWTAGTGCGKFRPPPGGLVHRVTNTTARVLIAACLLLTAGWSWRAHSHSRPSGAVVYEGARLITGDGRAPIENDAFVVH